MRVLKSSLATAVASSAASFALLCCACAQAQTAAPAPLVSGNPQPAVEPRIERITIEDAGSRVEELRYGGQTQRITVQPKAEGARAYEVQSTDGARSLPTSREGFSGPTGPSVWNVIKF